MTRHCSPNLVAAFWFAAVLALSVTSKATAEEAYYVLMFGQQRTPNQVNYSHTFATFVKASWVGSGTCPTSPVLEVRTISWLPASMRLRTAAWWPECGRDFDLHTTLRWGLGNCMRTSLWGPYRVRPELYYAAVRKAAVLESGQVLYKTNDLGWRSAGVSNCIHAVSSIVDGDGFSVLGPFWGEAASFQVLRRMQPWILCPGVTHPWIGSALGLDQYPIIYRDWQDLPSSALTRPLYRLLGGERDLEATHGPPAR